MVVAPGGLPKGAYLTKEFLDDFRSGEVTLAAITFLRFNDKYKVKPKSAVPQGKFSLHIEEQKLPPMGDDLLLKSASIVPMLSTEWQDAQDPEDREKSALARKFRWDGQFVANPEILGNWKVITEVAVIDEYDPAKKSGRSRNSFFTKISFNEDGSTNDPTWIWSADMLMNLNKYQALKITPKTLAGNLYLFIEAGGFGARQQTRLEIKTPSINPGIIMRKKFISILFILSLASGLTAADQQLELAAPFTDNAILQRESSVPVWGWDVPGSKVTVQFAGANQDGCSRQEW